MSILKKDFPSKHVQGIGLVLLGFFCASCVSALGKVLVQEMSLGMLLFTQNFFAFVFYVLFSLPLQKKHLKTSRFSLHLFRAIMGLGSYVCFFLAIKYIPLVNATLLANSAPLFLPFIIFFWGHQKISLGLWISLLIGFFGVFCIVNPQGGISSFFHHGMVFVALLGSLFSAIALQSIRRLQTSEKTTSINLYYFGLSALLTLPWACATWKSFDLTIWMFTLAIGLFLMLTQFFLATAYRLENPTVLGPFNYSIVVFTGILGWIFWNELPTIMGAIGLILISLGGMLSMTKLARTSR